MIRGIPTAWALLGLLALCGCGDDDVPAGTPTGNTATPTPTPAASATPAPEPTPSNRPPAVAVSSSGSCHPLPSRPCTVSFNALVQDPDGDSVRFGWDGCAHGNEPLAICTISAPGTVTARVLVDDGHGGLATGSATAEGTNAPPVVYIGLGPYGQPIPVPDPAPSNRTYTVEGTEPVDPEGDEEPNRLCTRAGLVVTGPCRATLFACGGVGHVFDIDIRTLQGPGTCVIEARVPDLWGAVGTARLTFTVSP